MAVITPVVFVSIRLRFVTSLLVNPVIASTVTKTLLDVSMVAALIAVAILAALPVNVPTLNAFTATVVFPSSVFKSAALTDVSATEILYALTVVSNKPAINVLTT